MSYILRLFLLLVVAAGMGLDHQWKTISEIYREHPDWTLEERRKDIVYRKWRDCIYERMRVVGFDDWTRPDRLSRHEGQMRTLIKLELNRVEVETEISLGKRDTRLFNYNWVLQRTWVDPQDSVGVDPTESLERFIDALHLIGLSFDGEVERLFESEARGGSATGEYFFDFVTCTIGVKLRVSSSPQTGYWKLEFFPDLIASGEPKY